MDATRCRSLSQCVNGRGVIEHLRRYAAPPLAQQSRVAGDAYDWSLNDAEGI